MHSTNDNSIWLHTDILYILQYIFVRVHEQYCESTVIIVVHVGYCNKPMCDLVQHMG